MRNPFLLPIGRIRKAHGIRGEVSVDYYADSPNLLSGGVFLQLGEEETIFHKVVSARFHHGALLVRFADIVDRNAAELLRGYDLLIPEERLPEPDDGAIYLHEILGLAVIVEAEDGTRTTLGILADITEPGGQELWTIVKDGEEDILLPAAPEFVLGFDLEHGEVRVSPPPGLIELYRT